MIPTAGDRAIRLKKYDGSWVDTGEVEGHPSEAAL
jgi:hypothetical protein